MSIAERPEFRAKVGIEPIDSCAGLGACYQEDSSNVLEEFANEYDILAGGDQVGSFDDQSLRLLLLGDGMVLPCSYCLNEGNKFENGQKVYEFVGRALEEQLRRNRVRHGMEIETSEAANNFN